MPEGQGYCGSCKHSKHIHDVYVMCKSRVHARMLDMSPSLPGNGAHQTALLRHKWMSLRTAESIALICPSWEQKVKEAQHA